MDVGDLPLDSIHVDHFREQGIESLYPPQAAAVEAGITEGERVVAAVPTASGKTFVAQLAMLTADGPALYVVPLRALATEKAATFEAMPDVSVGVATGDFDAPAEELGEHDVVVATSEKVDSAIRNGATWVRDLACVVVDEVHLLDSASRGPTLEVTIAKLRRARPDLQVVALSATVRNADDIAGWLDAELVTSDWRPVALRRGVYEEGVVTFQDGAEMAVLVDSEESPTRALVRDAVDDGGGCLVFVNSRRAARDLATSLADADVAASGSADGASESIRETATTGTGQTLADCVDRGVAFHHAGLRPEHRTAVEDGFRDRDISVIVATPTLAAGVNVPARRVVVRDNQRFTEEGMQPLPVLEVEQMFGRAGRPGLDPYGEAILVADGDADRLRERYVGADPEPVESHLANETALRTHVLATVAAGDADTRAGIDAVLAGSFHAYLHDDDRLARATDRVIEDLRAAGMLERDAGDGDPGPDGDRLRATDLGTLVSRVYVDPETGTAVVTGLDRAREMERVTSLTVLELVCDTPDMRDSYVRSDEAGRLTDAAMRRADELTKSLHDGDFHAWLGAFKTACVLDEWLGGTDPEILGERYGVGPGDLRRLAERAEWLLTATESLAEHLDSDARSTIRETRLELTELTV